MGLKLKAPPSTKWNYYDHFRIWTTKKMLKEIVRNNNIALTISAMLLNLSKSKIKISFVKILF